MTNAKIETLFRSLAGAGAAAARMTVATGGWLCRPARAAARIAGRRAAGIEAPFAASRISWPRWNSVDDDAFALEGAPAVRS